MPKSPSTPSHGNKHNTSYSSFFASATPNPRNTQQHHNVQINSPYFRKHVSPESTPENMELLNKKSESDNISTKEDKSWQELLPEHLLRCKPQLIQEELQDDWWKLLIATCLLNKTTGKIAIPVFREMLRRWPTPLDMLLAPPGKMESLLKPCGIRKRAHVITKLSAHFVISPPSPDKSHPSNLPNYPAYPDTPVSHLPGVGKYALDSFRIFCCEGDEWMNVVPQDKQLIKYLEWRWAASEGKRWHPQYGVLGLIPSDHFD